jgi:hypothetical protein
MEPRGTGRTCPHCGWEEGASQSSPAFLNTRTVLDGRYLIGRVLGAGGFGITYLAWDLDLDMKLAIKEYFPNSFGARDRNHSTVIPANTHSKDAFEHGLKKFLEEGKALARFQGHPSIASVMTFFRENGTSYLVMKYEDGITVQEYLKQHSGRLDFSTVVRIAMPIFDALRAVHQEGILHRDISPDNIIINRSRQIKILDFGSAKRDMTVRDSTLQITLKRGFSPEEQYRANGKQGPWTDVYAVGATFYQCLTGSKPPDALERLSDDTLAPPATLGVKMPKDAEKALLKALAVRAPNRFQTIDEFREAFITGEPAPDIDRPGIVERLRDQLRPFVQIVRANGRMISWAAGAALLLLVLIRLLPALLAAPEIREFAVDPPSVAAGQAATLRWSTSGGKLAISPGVGSVPTSAGTRQVFPKANTTYILTARGTLRSTTRSIKVAVTGGGPIVQQPVAINFTAEPLTIRAGGSTELVWSADGNPSRVSIDQGIGDVEKSGRRKVTPTANTTYTIVAEGPSGPVQSSVTVLLEAAVPRPVIASFTADPPTIRRGSQTSRLSWQVTPADALVTIDQNVGRIQTGNAVTVQPANTTQYKLVARSPGGTVNKTVTVEVVEPEPPKITSFTAQPESIPYHGSSVLSWSVSGESSVSISGIGPVQPEDRRRVNPAGTTTYTLTATGPGGSATKEVTVQVAAARAPVITTFSVNPPVIVRGQIVTLTWKVEGEVTGVTLDPGGQAIKADGQSTAQPTQNTTYTLTASGPGGSKSIKASVAVSNDAVTIAEFKVIPPKGKPSEKITIRHGEKAILTWKVIGPATEVVIDPVNIRGRLNDSAEVTPDKTTDYFLTPHAGNVAFPSKKVTVTVKK